MQITMEAARRQAGYTQKEAGKLFGVHYQTIGSWEKDNTKMPYSQIAKIPKIYGVASNDIFLETKTSLFVYSEKQENDFLYERRKKK